MRARDIMTSPVITVRPDTPVRAAAALLASHGFTAAPVVDEHGWVVGIVSEADLIRDQIPPEDWPVSDWVDRSSVPVREVMTPTPTGLSPDNDVTEVVAVMLESPARTVPIVDDGELVGIVSRRDVLRAVARGELTSEDVRRGRAGQASRDRGR